jgi:hypothetical protein
MPPSRTNLISLAPISRRLSVEISVGSRVAERGGPEIDGFAGGKREPRVLRAVRKRRGHAAPRVRARPADKIRSRGWGHRRPKARALPRIGYGGGLSGDAVWVEVGRP